MTRLSTVLFGLGLDLFNIKTISIDIEPMVWLLLVLQAVLGSINEDGTWAAQKLGMEHTTENLVEVERVYSEHPASEQDTVIRMDRLLGQLMPLRAFGDFRFKWSRQVSHFHNVNTF